MPLLVHPSAWAPRNGSGGTKDGTEQTKKDAILLSTFFSNCVDCQGMLQMPARILLSRVEPTVFL